TKTTAIPIGQYNIVATTAVITARRQPKPTELRILLPFSCLRRRGAFAPDCPVLRPSQLHFEMDHCLDVDPVHGVRLILGKLAVQCLAVYQQAFSAPKLHGSLAMLQALPARGLVGPGSRALDIGSPEQIAALSLGAGDRIGPKRHDDCSIGFAHTTPA